MRDPQRGISIEHEKFAIVLDPDHLGGCFNQKVDADQKSVRL